MTTQDLLALARKHLSSPSMQMESSARLCLADAVALNDEGQLYAARYRALRSLAFSVGIFHPDYRRAAGEVR